MDPTPFLRVADRATDLHADVDLSEWVVAGISHARFASDASPAKLREPYSGEVVVGRTPGLMRLVGRNPSRYCPRCRAS